MKAKKLFATLVVLLAVAFVLCACGGTTPSGGGNNPGGNTQTKKLQTPEPYVTEEGIEWSPVSGAFGYNFTVNGEGPFATDDNFLDVSDGDEVIVWAVGDGETTLDSDPSKPVVWHENSGGGGDDEDDYIKTRPLYDGNFAIAEDGDGFVLAYGKDGYLFVDGQKVDLYEKYNPNAGNVEYFKKDGENYVKVNFSNDYNNRRFILEGKSFYFMDMYFPEQVNRGTVFISEDGSFVRGSSLFENGRESNLTFAKCDGITGKSFLVDTENFTLTEATFEYDGITFGGKTYREVKTFDFSAELDWNYQNSWFFAKDSDLALRLTDAPTASLWKSGESYLIYKAGDKNYVRNSDDTYSSIKITEEALTYNNLTYLRYTNCYDVTANFFCFETGGISRISGYGSNVLGEGYGRTFASGDDTRPSLLVEISYQNNTVLRSKEIEVSGEDGFLTLLVEGKEFKQYTAVSSENYKSNYGIYKNDEDRYISVSKAFGVDDKYYNMYNVGNDAYLAYFNEGISTASFVSVSLDESSLTLDGSVYEKLTLTEAPLSVTEPIAGTYLHFDVYQSTRTIGEYKKVFVEDEKGGHYEDVYTSREVDCEAYHNYRLMSEYNIIYKNYTFLSSKIMMADGKIVGLWRPERIDTSGNVLNETTYRVFSVTDEGSLLLEGTEYKKAPAYASSAELDGMFISFGANYIIKATDGNGYIYHFRSVNDELRYISTTFGENINLGSEESVVSNLGKLYKIGDYLVSANSSCVFKLNADKRISLIGGTNGSWFESDFDELDNMFNIGKLYHDKKFEDKYYTNLDSTRVFHAVRESTGSVLYSRYFDGENGFSNRCHLFGGELGGETFYFYSTGDDFLCYLDTSSEDLECKPVTQENFDEFFRNANNENFIPGTYRGIYEYQDNTSDDSESTSVYYMFDITVNSPTDVFYRKVDVKRGGRLGRSVYGYNESSSSLLGMYVKYGHVLVMEFTYRHSLRSDDSGIRTMTFMNNYYNYANVTNSGVDGETDRGIDLQYQKPISLLTSLPEELKSAEGVYFKEDGTAYRLTEAGGKVHLTTYLYNNPAIDYQPNTMNVLYTDGEKYYLSNDSRDVNESETWLYNNVAKGVPYGELEFADGELFALYDFASAPGENCVYFKDENYQKATVFEDSSRDGLYAAKIYNGEGVAVIEIKGSEMIVKSFGFSCEYYMSNKQYINQKFRLFEQNGKVYAYNSGEDFGFLGARFEVKLNDDGTFGTKTTYLGSWSSSDSNIVYRRARIASYNEIPTEYQSSVWKANGPSGDEIVFDAETQTVRHGDNLLTVYVTDEGAIFLGDGIDHWLVTDEFIRAKDVGSEDVSVPQMSYFYPYKPLAQSGNADGIYFDADGAYVIVDGENITLSYGTVCKMYATKKFSNNLHVYAVFAEKIAEDGTVTYIEIKEIDATTRPTCIIVDGKNYDLCCATSYYDGNYLCSDAEETLAIEKGDVTVSDKDGNVLYTGTILTCSYPSIAAVKLEDGEKTLYFVVTAGEDGSLAFDGNTYKKAA